MALLRARTIKPAATWSARNAADDYIELPHDGRYRRRVTMRTEGDLVFVLDLPEATRLMHGDGLVLDDGRIIAIAAADEPVTEITANDAHHLSRIAWHLGNRHLPTEILPDRLRIEPDPVIEEMVRGLGGTVRRTEARFEPEGGAYEHGAGHDRGHTHHHNDGDDHAHHHDHDRGGRRHGG